MLVSINWLREFIDFDLSEAELSDRLTMSGMEVEEIIHNSNGEGDVSFDLNVTPNRPDCLSIFGVAREVGVITGKAIKIPEFGFSEGDTPVEDHVSVKVRVPDFCPRYTARLIRGVRISDSPRWIQKRLRAVGQRPVNNVVDITNYILFETGHPLHAFDFQKISGHQVIVRNASKGEAFTGIDGIKYALEPDMSVIADAERAIALAGVIGGENTEVTEETTDVLLESAYFTPSHVRRTAKKLGIHTESSHRFERGTDREGLVNSLDRAAMLIVEICGGECFRGRIDEMASPITPLEVSLRFKRINEILGETIDSRDAIRYLERIGVKATKVNEDMAQFKIPTFRTDLEREIDLIEEVARLHGYNEIRETVPVLRFSKGRIHFATKRRRQVRRILADSGFSEAINYSFVDEKINSIFCCHCEGERSPVFLRNPLSNDMKVMRVSLLPGLLQNIHLNLSRNNENIKIFEIGNVFSDKGTGLLPDEKLLLSGAITGVRNEALWSLQDKKGEADFYDVKGIIETVLDAFKIHERSFAAASLPFLGNGIAASLETEGKLLGFLGILSPSVLKAFDITKKVFVFELDFESILKIASSKKPEFKSLPRFPAISRDLAIVVDRKIESDVFINAIKKNSSDLLEEVKLFDMYEGKGIPDGTKSLAFSLTYRSSDRTLRDSDIDESFKSTVEALMKMFDIKLR